MSWLLVDPDTGTTTQLPDEWVEGERLNYQKAGWSGILRVILDTPKMFAIEWSDGYIVVFIHEALLDS